MPTLLSEKIIDLEMSDLHTRVMLKRPKGGPPKRHVGYHQSTILAYIAEKQGYLKPGEKDEEEYPLIWALGNAWEEYILSFYPEIKWQPGEMVVDEIAMNRDGHNSRLKGIGIAAAGEAATEEAKFTFKSCATGEEFLNDKKWWMWRMQVAEYCHGAGTRIGRWHVCHVRGDYKKFGPIYKQYTLRYTDLEVKQAHGMLMNHKKFVQPEGTMKKVGVEVV